jgi:hypothetical protein
MEQELKDKWIAALRSGKYKQGKYQLRDSDNCYCCLGVLCEVAGIPYDGESCLNNEGVGVSYEPIRNILPGTGLGIFYTMNDRDGKSFSEIANYIELNL